MGRWCVCCWFVYCWLFWCHVYFLILCLDFPKDTTVGLKLSISLCLRLFYKVCMYWWLWACFGFPLPCWWRTIVLNLLDIGLISLFCLLLYSWQLWQFHPVCIWTSIEFFFRWSIFFSTKTFWPLFEWIYWFECGIFLAF